MPPKKHLKRKKDPKAPKRALSAYMYFANENRKHVVDEHPNVKFGEIGKLLGERWKELDPHDKKPYEKLAMDDKVRYKHEKEAYDSKS